MTDHLAVDTRQSGAVHPIEPPSRTIYPYLSGANDPARKLIGATAAGELAWYNTYVSYYNREWIAAAVAKSLADFARSCGLRLSDTATPEVLHKGYWYDDGNEPWAEFAESSQPDPEEDLPS